MNYLRTIAFAAISAAVLLGAGCQKEELQPENPPSIQVEKEWEPMVVSAVIGEVEPDTKTYLNITEGADFMTPFWKADDEIGISAISINNGTTVINKPFRLRNTTAGSKRGEFYELYSSPSTVWPDPNAEPHTYYVAIYPYDIAATFDDESQWKIVGGNPVLYWEVFSLRYPTVQNLIQGPDGSFKSGVMVAFVPATPLPEAAPPSKASGAQSVPTLNFKNIFSIIKLSVKGEGTLRRITFIDKSGKPVSGKFNLELAGSNNPPILNTIPSFPETAADEASKTIELNLGTGITLDPTTATDFYISVPPRTYTNGYEIKLFADEGYLIKSRSTSSVMESGKYYTTPEINVVSFLPYEQYEGSFTDLSAGGTANCYIAPAAGYYSFNAAVIGNGDPGLLPAYTQEVKRFHTENTAITPLSARVLWADTYNLVSEVRLTADKKVTFKVSAEKGNAVIAVYDKANPDEEGAKILWSWHIWCTDVPGTQVYYTGQYTTPADNFTLQDRDLGATSATPGTTPEEKLATYGLHYQWGRKDPFPGSCSTTENGEKTLYGAVSERGWIPTSQTVGTIIYSVEHPITFYRVNDYSSADWYYGEGSGSSNRNNYLLGNPDGYTVTNKGSKSIYDPCPPGYMVPSKNTWTNFETVEGNNVPNVKGTWNNGHNFYLYSDAYYLSGEHETAWYPASGYRRSIGSISLSETGSYGFHWSNTIYSENTEFGCPSSFSKNYVSVRGGEYRGNGYSVRCAQIPAPSL